MIHLSDPLSHSAGIWGVSEGKNKFPLLLSQLSALHARGSSSIDYMKQRAMGLVSRKHDPTYASCWNNTVPVGIQVMNVCTHIRRQWTIHTYIVPPTRSYTNIP